LLVGTIFTLFFAAKIDVTYAATYYRRPPPVKPLPPMKWESLEAGLAKAKSSNKPAIVVFTTSNFKGPGTFESWPLRNALTKSGAIPIRVLPPVAPVLAPNASADEINRVQKSYAEALKKYQETARQYGVAEIHPVVAFVEPNGAVLWTLRGPGHDDMLKHTAGLPQGVREYEAMIAREKAKAAASGSVSSK